MRLLNDFVDGFVDGLTAVAALSGNQGVRLIERWCAELGWEIDERIGSTGMILHFKDPLIRIRKLMITIGDSGKIAAFSVYSASQLPPRQVTGEIMAYLLHRNSQVFSAWQMTPNDDGTVTFAVANGFPLQGMNAGMFKAFCETLVKEAHDLDAKLQSSGLL